jgi:hypothetical protein
MASDEQEKEPAHEHVVRRDPTCFVATDQRCGEAANRRRCGVGCDSRRLPATLRSRGVVLLVARRVAARAQEELPDPSALSAVAGTSECTLLRNSEA